MTIYTAERRQNIICRDKLGWCPGPKVKAYNGLASENSPRVA